jgi:hypothetical protein
VQLAREAIPTAGDCQNQPAILTQCATQRVNLDGQIIFLNCSPRPHQIHQLGFSNHRPARIDQREQYVERAATQFYGLAIGKKLPPPPA